MNVTDRLKEWWLRRKLVRTMTDEALDEFLELLLKVIALKLRIDADYRKNIAGFKGRYVFRTHDGKIAVSAIFENGELKVLDDEIAATDVTVSFKDGAALCKFLLSKDPDVFAFILDNKIDYEGNLNYVLKFGYMAKRLQLELAA